MLLYKLSLQKILDIVNGYVWEEVGETLFGLGIRKSLAVFVVQT